ncbi:MAG: hypothetical protein IAG13_06230 [Deltaproteobacteria bacterium]|nr:hypothetical protein [Nannocystaceae bacterium]
MVGRSTSPAGAALRRLVGLSLAAAALLLAPRALAAEAPADAPAKPRWCERSDEREHADLGILRYQDPRCLRSIHLGFELGGVALPARLGLFDRTVWSVRGGPSWSIRLAKWMSLGGRNGITIYDATTVRLRVHDHQVEAAFHPIAASGYSRIHDRLAIGVETHAVLQTKVDGVKFKLGGVRDVVAYLGYGMEHALGERWALGWQAHYRHAWVFRDTQRQLRGAMRVSFMPKPAHRVSLEATGFFVDRDSEQGGVSLPRRGVYGQLAAEYGWMSRYGVGPMVRVRYATGFFSGEAPIFELRQDSLDASYGDVTIGLRARWR